MPVLVRMLPGRSAVRSMVVPSLVDHSLRRGSAAAAAAAAAAAGAVGAAAAAGAVGAAAEGCRMLVGVGCSLGWVVHPMQMAGFGAELGVVALFGVAMLDVAAVERGKVPVLLNEVAQGELSQASFAVDTAAIDCIGRIAAAGPERIVAAAVAA